MATSGERLRTMTGTLARRTTGNTVEESGLTCPVGTNETDDLVFVDLKRDILKGPKTPEILR